MRQRARRPTRSETTDDIQGDIDIGPETATAHPPDAAVCVNHLHTPDAPALLRLRDVPRTSVLDGGFAAALTIGLAWTPFWLGGAWRLSWGVNALLFPGLTLSYEVARAAARRAPSLAVRDIAAPVALFGLALVWIVAQTLPLGMAPAIAQLGDRTPATISVDPGATAIALTRLLSEACVFWLAAQLGGSEKICLYLLRAVATIATLYCAYGLFLAAAYDNAIPGFAPPDGGGEVRSTFVNRNTFAAFAGLGFATILALGARAERTRSHASPAARWLEKFGRRGPLLAAGLVVLAALLGSASRGGVISCAAGVVVLLGLLAQRRRRRGQGRVSLFATAATLLLAFVVLGGPLAARVADIGFSDLQRLAVYRITLDAALARPFLGFGYGAFASVFPLYRDATLSPVGVWEMAHNAYLELALELGFVSAAALILAPVLLAGRCLKGALRRNRHEEAPLAAVSASALIGVNALVDYSVQIEAVTLTFMALLGLGVAQSRGAAARAQPC